jgi:ABC-type branched-subunit amino acid transport system ATPase component
MHANSNLHLPSRHSNPFATCWTRPGALAFQFATGEGAEQLIAQFKAAGGRGAILGPHGSGKSTLLATLQPLFAAAGWNVAMVTLRDRERRLPRGFLRAALCAKRPLVIVDGYEQLSIAQRLLLRLRCRWWRAGLLVTAHEAADLPVLYRTHVTRRLARQLVSTLTTQNSSPISHEDIAASLAGAGSNLRELFFALYERHEALAAADRAVARTATAAAP